MYSELLAIAKESGFRSSGSNLCVREDTIAGNHIKVVIKNGKFSHIIPTRQDKGNKERMVLAFQNNFNSFPKINVGPKMVDVFNIPVINKGKTNFSGMTFLVDQKQAEKTQVYCKKIEPEFLNKGVVNGKQTTLFGESVIGFASLDPVALFTSVFSELLFLSKTNDIALAVLEDFCKEDNDGNRSYKIPMVICMEDSGKFSSDVSDLVEVSRIIPPPGTKTVDFNGKKIDIYEVLPQFKFPWKVTSIFSHNPDTYSLSVYGKEGSEVCVIPYSDYNYVIEYLKTIFTPEGNGKTYKQVPLSRFSNGAICVITKEKNVSDEILCFLDDTKDEKAASIEVWKNRMISMISKMKADKGTENESVEFVVFCQVDTATSGIATRISLKKSDVIAITEEWETLGMPSPSKLSRCFNNQFRFDGKDVVLVDKRRVLGYDNILKFIFGNDVEITKKIIRVLSENIRSYAVAKNNPKANIQDRKLGEDMEKFLSYAIRKVEDMKEMNATIGHMCVWADKLQREYWKEKNIEAKNGKTIGSETLSLIQSRRIKDAYMHLTRNIVKYVDWAKTKYRKGELDASTYANLQFSKELAKIKEGDLEAFFKTNLTDIDVAQISTEYLSEV